ncbi:MAG TPA: 4-alpha-glucanotransferase [Vicinamibacterales bacterium]|jgi:4-alpha-glucanotransferase
MPRDFFHDRHAGLLVPLFSIPSRTSWGIGELSDLPALGAWLSDAGFSFVQLLPLNEMAGGQNSPYSALSAMAIDPIFIAPSGVPDIEALGGEAVLDERERRQLEAARRAPTIDYGQVRALKTKAFRAGFARFLEVEWRATTPRARRLQRFTERARWWLDAYAIFRALHARYEGRAWTEWEPALRDRSPAALAQAQAELGEEVLFYAYLQWLAAEQWAQAREAAEVGVFGDFPFMVSGDSADVWSRQEDFRMDASVGAPPDAFSETGQDWGFPAYRWDRVAAGGFQWLAARARRNAELYDAYRVDHLVGFFRTYVRETDGRAGFVPGDEPAQVRQGERVLEVLSAAGARLIAEDLGVIPGFVRDALLRLGIPGFKVLRWERDWDREGQPFRDPGRYPAVSVATSGTHDTEPNAQWWDEAPIEERRAAVAVLGEGLRDPDAPFDERIRDAILDTLFLSGSDIALVPIHDVFGWRERINTPALVSDANWTWRLPWPVDALQAHPMAAERAVYLRELIARSRR